MRQPAVYIMASQRNGTLYTGVTLRPVAARVPTPGGADARLHDAVWLQDAGVYHQAYPDMDAAIAREKQIKGGSRRKKLMLIDRFNPEWRDLYADLA